jgi:hypothetical protein
MSEPVTTPLARLAYPRLFERRKAGEMYAGKFTAELWFPKDMVNATTMKPLADAIKDCIKEAWPQGAPKGLVLPLKDGDQQNNEAYAGYYFIRVQADKIPPKCYRKTSKGEYQQIIEPSELYPGCWVIAQVSPFPYRANPAQGRPNNGVSFGLDLVLFVKDGESFISSNNSDPVKAFDGVSLPETPQTAEAPESGNAGIPGLNFG